MYLDISKYNTEKFRQQQINEAIFKNLVPSIEDISNIPKELKQKLQQDVTFPSIQEYSSIENEQIEKSVFETQDKKKIESVLIKHKKNRQTICVSSQIGCPIGCKFCATGMLGFERNLSYQEIVDQVLHFARKLKVQNAEITNIVFMGMGEPFLNTQELGKSVDILTRPEEYNIASRRITISTIWTGSEILEFVKKHPQINLAISLHSAIQEKRDMLIPISQKITLEDIKKDIDQYFTISNRRLTLEYLMLKDINDTEQDAKALIKFLESYDKKLIHINLLPYNDTTENYKTSDKKTILNFKKYLEKNKINTTIRKSMGQDIGSACGMLRNSTSLPQ